LFKAGFARVRPDAQFAQFVADGASYPSGHSSMAAVVYLTLGALIARMHRRRIEKAYILGAAASLALLVGISRAAMGVHWATDVAGGWALGIAWAAACMFTVRWADR
jgi:undecaprenyl-diphosphatase